MFILNVLMISSMCCMICIHASYFFAGLDPFHDKNQNPSSFVSIHTVCGDKQYCMGWSYIHDVWPQYVCLHDSVLHNHLQALVLIYFGFVIQAARRCEYV